MGGNAINYYQTLVNKCRSLMKIADEGGLCRQSSTLYKWLTQLQTGSLSGQSSKLSENGY